MVRLSHLLCLALLVLTIADASDSKQKEEEEGFSEEKRSAEVIGTFELRTDKMYAKFTNWGATLMSFRVPDKDGNMTDVVLGYDNVDEYRNDTVYFGATLGRVSNRIGGAHFNLDRHAYNLEANDGNNTLHGGPRGFSDVVWRMEKLVNKSSKPSITFSYNSFDGEEGFPGELRVKVQYTLNLKKNSMTIHMTGKPSNMSTPVNLANHAYWNLGGHDSGDILSHNIQIFGSRITPVDSEFIPTGEFQDVNGTAYDFLAPSDIRSKMQELMPMGYDINYALDNAGVDGNSSKIMEKDNASEADSKVITDRKKRKRKKSNTTQLHHAAVVEDPKSGRRMQVSTNQPGLQFYTSGNLTEVNGKNGTVYRKFAGLCLETQGFPDSVNHPNFPSQIVRPGEVYKHVMEFKFSAVPSNGSLSSF